MNPKNESAEPKRDHVFSVIVVLVVMVVLWLLLTPIVPAIARSTMNRFHLQGESFVWFAVQQPIPAMYNFANEYEVRDFPEGFVESFLDTSQRRYINHFPARVMTFANTRYTLQVDGTDRWVTLWSTYRGQSIESRFHIKPIGENRFELVRETQR